MSTILHFPEQPRPLLVTDIPDLWVEILRTLWNNKHRGALNMREVSQETGLPVHIAGYALLEMKTKGFVTDEVSPFWRYQLDGKGLWAILSLVAIHRAEGFTVQGPSCVHENRDQAMSCPRYFDGTHGANHFSTETQQNRTEAIMLAESQKSSTVITKPELGAGCGEKRPIHTNGSTQPIMTTEYATGAESAKDSAPLLSCVRRGLDGFIARVDEIVDRETAPAEENNEDLGTIRFHHITGRQ